MKKFFSMLLLATVVCLSSFAYDFEANGIFYALTDEEWDSETDSYVYRSVAVTSGDALYAGDISIPSSVIYNEQTYPVKYIWDEAFANCPRLTSVLLPNTIQSIHSAFQNCKMLSSVSLQDGLTSIMYGAFAGCTSLTSMVIPNSVTILGSSLFDGCTALQSVTLPNNITTLPGHIFYGCTNLTSVAIPETVTELEYSCFSGCERLTHITLPQNLTKIGSNCFCETAIAEITIPASVTYIGSDIFCNRTKIQAIYMQGATAPLLEGSTISYNTDLTIYIPCGALEDYQNVWGTNFRFVEMNQNISFQTTVAPEGAGYISITGDCDATDVSLTANSNAGYAFLMWSDGVSTPTRNVSVNSTQTYTAMFAKALHWEVYKVWNGYERFYSEGYALPNTQVTIEVDKVWDGYQVFYQWRDGNTNNPRTFTITQDTTFYAHYTEGGMVGEDIIFQQDGDTLRAEGSGDMYDGTTSYIIMEDKDWYAEMWYYLLYQVNGVSMSEGITSIGEALFYDMQTLSEVTIPSTITEIRARAFENCRKLKMIHFAANSQLQTIGNWAFYNCHNLRSLTLPEGVTNVGDAAFYGCNYLTEITLPSTMKKVADNAFALCPRMQTMYVNALVPPTIEAKTFEDVDRATPVFVPRGTIALYQADQYWSEFFNMAEYDAPSGNLNTAVGNDNHALRKVLRNGQVIILRGDKEYNVMGQAL